MALSGTILNIVITEIIFQFYKAKTSLAGKIVATVP